MIRRFFTGLLLALSSILLAFSVIAIAALWIYNKPLKTEIDTRLVGVDLELSQIEATMQFSQVELERALRIVESTEKALDELTRQTGDAENLFENIQSKLDDELLPELKLTRERIEAARNALEDLHLTLRTLRSLPFINLSVPDQILTDLIASADSLDSEIADAEDIARQASTFVGDTSHLLGGDLTETKESLQTFLTALEEYEGKVTGWRGQIAELKEGAPGWIDRTSIGLTIFLAWFALSQFGMILHGISLQYGDNPLWVLRGK